MTVGFSDTLRENEGGITVVAAPATASTQSPDLRATRVRPRDSPR